jgi:hypothetical protein
MANLAALLLTAATVRRGWSIAKNRGRAELGAACQRPDRQKARVGDDPVGDGPVGDGPGLRTAPVDQVINPCRESACRSPDRLTSAF